MPLSTVVTFRGGCRQAIAYYQEIFPELTVTGLQTFSDQRSLLGPALKPEHEALVYRAELGFSGGHMVAGDSPSLLFLPKEEWSMGITDNLIFEYTDREEQISRIYNRLMEHGKANSPLKPKPPFALFGSLIDQYGLCWNLASR